jgi:RimJ/RimL family protein N-acetyltransferase
MNNALFRFEEDYILEDERVKLRPLLMEDIATLKYFSVHEPELWQYSLATAAGEAQLQQYIHKAIIGRTEHREYPFIVYDKKMRQFAGSTRFYDIQLAYQTLQLGYTWYGKTFQGTGLNKHCKFLLLEFAFETLHMERVEFRADAANERSIAAMKSIGCKVDGVLRSNMPRHQGGRRDSIVLSILKQEWETEVKPALQKKL